MTNPELDPIQPNPKQSRTEPAPDAPADEPDEFEPQDDPTEQFLDHLMEDVAGVMSDIAWSALYGLWSHRGKPFKVNSINFDHQIEVWQVVVEMENRDIRTVLVVGNPETGFSCIDPVQPVTVVEAGHIPWQERKIW